MTRKLLFIILFSCLPFYFAFAIPTHGVKRTVTLADSSVVELTLCGDEDYHFWKADDGRAFVENDGVYSAISLDDAISTWRRLHRQRGVILDNSSLAKRRVGRKNGDFIGKKKGLVILMQFPDVKFSVSSDVNSLYNDYFNKEGFNEFGMSGSVHDYFKDQSYGKFDLTFDVLGPYTSKYHMSYYGHDEGEKVDVNAGDLVKEACDAAFNQVNFKDYDWNGDGEVDQVYIIYAGYGENYGASDYTIWPHEYYLEYSTGTLSYDGELVNQYAISCELRGTSGNVLDGIGSPCHEFSHCLGLPDFYDVSYSGSTLGIGYWDILSDGSYNNDSCTPAGYTSYERLFAGWIEPKEISSMTSVSNMKPLVDTSEAYILYNEGNSNEYNLLENRQAKSWDAYCGGHGLLVLHVDFKQNAWDDNEINTDESHMLMSIIPADNELSKENIDGDPFPGTSGSVVLNRKSTPAASVFNANADGSYFMNKNIDSITENEDGTVSFVACRPDPSIPAICDPVVLSTSSFSVDWPAVEGAVSYDVCLTEVPVAAHDFDTCLLLEEDFSKCTTSSVGLTDIGPKLGNYLNNSGWQGSKVFCSPNGLRLGTSLTAGMLGTPVFDTIPSGEITFAVHAKLYDQSTPVTGCCRNITMTENSKQDFKLSEDGWLLFQFSGISEKSRCALYPDSRMYVDHAFALEGTWDIDELPSLANSSSRMIADDSSASSSLAAGGVSSSSSIVTDDSSSSSVFTTEDSRLAVRRRISSTTNTTTATSTTFEGLNPTNTYYVKVRSYDVAMCSDWSEEKKVVLTATSITDIIDDSCSPNAVPTSVSYYDLSGREIYNCSGISNCSEAPNYSGVSNPSGSVIPTTSNDKSSSSPLVGIIIQKQKMSDGTIITKKVMMK